MKFNFYIIFFFFSISFILNAQNKAVDEIFNKYADSEGFKAVVMSDPASVLLKNKSNEESELARDLLKGIKTIKTIAYKPDEGKPNQKGKNFCRDIAKFNPGNSFTEIFSLNEGKVRIKSMVNKSGDKVSEFVMIISGENESTLIWLNGDINVQSIGNIGRLLHLRTPDKGTKKQK